MLTLLLAAQLTQVQPLARPVSSMGNPPMLTVNNPGARKRRMIADAHALLERAHAANQNYVPRAGGPTKAELDASADQLESNLDSMSEMGEMDSLRLQMAMDRMSKLMSTLSNIMKKISDTSQSITNNMK